MGAAANTIHDIFRKTSILDPLAHSLSKNNDIAYNFLKPKPAPVVNAPPNVSTAANLASQQDDLRNKQRGVLSNIFAGNNAAAPATSSGTVLGG